MNLRVSRQENPMAEYRVYYSKGDTGVEAGVWSKDDGGYELHVKKYGKEVRIPCTEEDARRHISRALGNPDPYLESRRLV